MYNHIAIETIDDSLDFFNVKEFDYDETSNVYRLLSQNNQWHLFPKEQVKQIVM